MNYIEAIFNLLRNKTLNSLGVERDLMRLIQARLSRCFKIEILM